MIVRNTSIYKNSHCKWVKELFRQTVGKIDSGCDDIVVVVATTRHASNSYSNELGIYVFIEARRHFDRIICRIWPHRRHFQRILCARIRIQRSREGIRSGNFTTSWFIQITIYPLKTVLSFAQYNCFKGGLYGIPRTSIYYCRTYILIIGFYYRAKYIFYNKPNADKNINAFFD